MAAFGWQSYRLEKSLRKKETRGYARGRIVIVKGTHDLAKCMDREHAVSVMTDFGARCRQTRTALSREEAPRCDPTGVTLKAAARQPPRSCCRAASVSAMPYFSDSKRSLGWAHPAELGSKTTKLGTIHGRSSRVPAEVYTTIPNTIRTMPWRVSLARSKTGQGPSRAKRMTQCRQQDTSHGRGTSSRTKSCLQAARN